jgi:ABC-2 type transport system ATP-binding protein
VIQPITPALEIRDLQKSYGGQQALQGVSFSLAAGERLAFLGPNGAGKTTLIRCLAGRTKPDGGKITLLGEPIAEAGVRQTLGLVPQEIALYRDLTTRENLKAFGKFYGLSRKQLRDRIAWALAWTGLENRADQLVGTFSGGMKRRVNIACGVLHAPQILLLDEPTVGVDPQSRQRIFQMLDDLNEHGTALLLTTHHLEEAEQRSDRIVILDQGQVIADGSLSELVDQTVGTSRLVKVRVDRPLTNPILASDGATDLQACEAQVFQARIDDVANQLMHLLHAVRKSGYQVCDVEVHPPSLHHVFLHLTGNELRE